MLPVASDVDAGALCGDALHVTLLLLLFALVVWLEAAVSDDTRQKDPPHPQPPWGLKCRSWCDPRGCGGGGEEERG